MNRFRKSKGMCCQQFIELCFFFSNFRTCPLRSFFTSQVLNTLCHLLFTVFLSIWLFLLRIRVLIALIQFHVIRLHEKETLICNRYPQIRVETRTAIYRNVLSGSCATTATLATNSQVSYRSVIVLLSGKEVRFISRGSNAI